MEKYKDIKKTGDGSFGSVVKAQNTQNGEIVAIKKMKQKYTSWDECMNLRELKALRKLNHINIIKLKEVVRANDELSFVFEYIEKNIYQVYDENKKMGKNLPEEQIRSMFYQIANSLAFMHKNGFFHRDLKPENLLYSEKGIVKLIDFGLAREIRSRPPYTDYVSTRWYRAPELLLRSTTYNSPIDIFALGCIMAELYQMKPLFNGSSEIDQLNKIVAILGTPNKQDWADGYKLASQKGYSFQQFNGVPFTELLSNAPPEAISLISECLQWNPLKRPTAPKVLQHPYFQNIQDCLPRELNQSSQSNVSMNSSTSSTKKPEPSSRRLVSSREGQNRENLYKDSDNIDTTKEFDEQLINKKPLNVSIDNKQQNFQTQKKAYNQSVGELSTKKQLEIPSTVSNSSNNTKPTNKNNELDTIYEFLNGGEVQTNNNNNKQNDKHQFQHYQQQSIQQAQKNSNKAQSGDKINLNNERLHQKKHEINYQSIAKDTEGDDEIEDTTGFNNVNHHKQQGSKQSSGQFDSNNNYYSNNYNNGNSNNIQDQYDFGNQKDRGNRATSLQPPQIGRQSPLKITTQAKPEFVYSGVQTSLNKESEIDILGKYLPSGISAQGQRKLNMPSQYHQKPVLLSSNNNENSGYTLNNNRMPVRSVMEKDNNSYIPSSMNQKGGDQYNFGSAPKPYYSSNLNLNSVNRKTSQPNQNDLYDFNNIQMPQRIRNL